MRTLDLVNRKPLLKFFVALLAFLFTASHFGAHDVSAQILGQDWTATFFNNTTLSGEPVATASFPNGLIAFGILIHLMIVF
jgi:hypothetical protein